MASYKKSFVSIAAAVAISASVASADYLPLANATLDDEWMLFGVSGFLTDGATAGVAGAFTIGTGAANVITDSYTGDELFETSGLTVVGGDLGTLKVLNTNEPVEIRVDTTGATFDETEPTRTIYVDTDGDGVGDFAFTYKAQLEGERLEYSVNSGDVYFLTIDYTNTYDNPIAGTLIPATSGTAGTELKELVGANSLIDYDFTNNPLSVASFDAATHRDAEADNESLRLYSYDVANGGLWSLFDSRYADDTNDFLSLEKGRAYWGKLDMGTQLGTLAGLVLGSSTVSATDYQALNLAQGWNLVSFNKANNSELRRANTGLLATVTIGAGSIVLKDSSGNQSVTVALAGTEADAAEVAGLINFAIVKAKAEGTIPNVFDLRAFATSATQIAFLSNKKFSIHEVGAGTILSAVQTLTGGDVINPTTGAVAAAPYDVTSDGAASVYGEYAMVIEPLAGVGASTLGNAKLNIKSQLETVAGGTDNDVTIITDLTTAVGALGGATGISAYELDVNTDGTTEHALLASTEPFYLRDQTFSRVFSYSDSLTAGAITITGAGTQNVASIAIATGSDANTVAGVIDATAVMADDDGSGNIVIIATDPAASDFAAFHISGGDNLNASTTNHVLADGSVADVYSVSSLAKKAITNTVTSTMADAGAGVAAAGETVTITVSTLRNAALAIPAYTTVLADTASATFYTNLETYLNTYFTNNNIDATVAITNTGAFAAAVITITGSEVYAITALVHSTVQLSGTFAADVGNIDTTGMAGDLASDLKYNAVYTPNYVMDGPLYTMREAGFDLKALVTGTMPMDGVSTMQWDSIDLTRVPSEWFTSQDYNLFDTDEQAGYWAYLEPNAAANPLSIPSNEILLSPLDYVHYYDGATTTNAFSTNIKVAVYGIDETRDPDTVNGGSKSARVTVTIGGKKTELTREAQNLYSGKINFYEVEGVNANTAFSMIIDAADGLGNKISTTTSIIDNQKPTVPTASFDGSSITVESPSADVAAYYVFDTTIPEDYTSGDELTRLVGSGQMIGTGICGSDVTSASAAGALKVVAVDGTGTIYGGNVSNSASVAYMAIAKDRIVLSDINNNEIDPSVGGTPYSTTCTAGTPVTTNVYGLQLTSMTNTKTAKIAFSELPSGVDVLATPITVHVRNAANDAVARITYGSAYEGQGVFIMLNGVVYGYTLPNAATAAASTPAAGIDLSVAGTVKTGVTF